MIPSAHLSLKCLNSTAVRLRLKKTTRVSLKKVCSGMNKQLPFRCTLSLKTNRLTKKNPQRVTPLCFYLTPRHVNPNYKIRRGSDVAIFEEVKLECG